MWKEVALNASSDQTQYRVWDYPIKEQYGTILKAIERTGPVPDAATGFRKVCESGPPGTVSVSYNRVLLQQNY